MVMLPRVTPVKSGKKKLQRHRSWQQGRSPDLQARRRSVSAFIQQRQRQQNAEKDRETSLRLDAMQAGLVPPRSTEEHDEAAEAAIKAAVDEAVKAASAPASRASQPSFVDGTTLDARAELGVLLREGDSVLLPGDRSLAGFANASSPAAFEYSPHLPAVPDFDAATGVTLDSIRENAEASAFINETRKNVREERAATEAVAECYLGHMKIIERQQRQMDEKNAFLTRCLAEIDALRSRNAVLKAHNEALQKRVTNKEQAHHSELLASVEMLMSRVGIEKHDVIGRRDAMPGTPLELLTSVYKGQQHANASEAAARAELHTAKEELHALRKEVHLLQRTANAHRQAKKELLRVQARLAEVDKLRFTVLTQERVIEQLQALLETQARKAATVRHDNKVLGFSTGY